MKFSNLIGVLTGCLFLALAIGFASDHPMTFLNLPGLLIVLGGTITAVLVSVPFKDAIAAFKQIKVITEPLNVNMQEDIARIMVFAKLWFRNQYNQIDSELERMDDPFLQRGLQMVRDKQAPEDVMALLNWKISQYRAKETAVINIFRSMATFAPAFGMVGSLVGLVNMLQEVENGAVAGMTADMAIALVTTFYGLLLANLIFKPVASKLEQRRNIRTMQLSMIAEGVALIQQHRTPSAIQDTLMSYIQGQYREPQYTESSSKLAPKLSV
ncbi:MAG: MotA/TolQ/ExbB proton channel family protein [Oleiphilaceae bacterium]|nr:MotA/TolQ/ExbB proton channel family protein [Oleiphilaceae bacterium]